MNFGMPIAGSTLALVALGLTGLTIIAYILKMRRRRFEVPFSTLWQRVMKEKEANSFWRHLRRILSFLLMMAIFGLLLFAALDPEIGRKPTDARSVVIIVDASASMKTLDEGEDGDRTRFDVAKDKAHELLDAMGQSDYAMLMKMDGQTTPVSRFVADKPMLRKSLDDITVSDTPADLRRALSAATDALYQRQNPTIILIGDGGYDEQVLNSVVWSKPKDDATKAPAKNDKGFRERALAAIDLSGVDVRYIPVGKRGDNVGIVAFNVRRYPANRKAFEVFVELENFGDKTVKKKLLLCSGDNEIEVWNDIEIPKGSKLRKIKPGLSGETDTRLRAELRPVASLGGCRRANKSQAARRKLHDIFALDDVAYALLPQQSQLKVLLVTPDNLYLEAFVLVYNNVEPHKYTPTEYDQAMANGSLGKYDVIIFDGHTPAKVPPAPTSLVYFGPRGDHAPFKIVRTLKDPRITQLNKRHPVMKWISLSDTHFDTTSVFAVDRAAQEIWLAKSLRAPIVVAKNDQGRKVLAFGFGLSDLDFGGTDMVLRVAFPMLLVNSLDWFSGDDSDLIKTYATGNKFRVPLGTHHAATDVTIETPDGRTIKGPLVEGNATFYGHSIGIHKLVSRHDGQEVALEVAANLSNPQESNVRPRAELLLGNIALKPPEGFSASYRQAIWMYLCFAALVLLLVEWITYNRRVTV